MVNGPMHVYGDAPVVAGTNLNIVVPSFARPGEVRTVAIKRGGTDALTISLTATIKGWGPFTFILASGVVATEWNSQVNFALPNGTELGENGLHHITPEGFQSVGLEGGRTIGGKLALSS